MLARQMLAALPRGRRLPFVTTLHGTDITLVGLDRSYLPITRYSIEQSDGAISQYLRERTLTVFDVRNHIENRRAQRRLRAPAAGAVPSVNPNGESAEPSSPSAVPRVTDPSPEAHSNSSGGTVSRGEEKLS